MGGMGAQKFTSGFLGGRPRIHVYILRTPTGHDQSTTPVCAQSSETEFSKDQSLVVGLIEACRGLYLGQGLVKPA